MASATLSKHDLNILEKIKDPEFGTSPAILIDDSIDRDPHIREREMYERLVKREKDALVSVRQVELKLVDMRQKSEPDLVEAYRSCILKFDNLIDKFPNYASARNNRVQALRRLYGDAMLVSDPSPSTNALLKAVKDTEMVLVSSKALRDLDKAIELLTPATPWAGVSRQQAKTLSMAHTQRAAIYHETSKRLCKGTLRVDKSRREASWKTLQFEDGASRDFAMGGRYGCEVAKGLAVSTNPTAKLCGQMVREAMKKEYGPEYGP